MLRTLILGAAVSVSAMVALPAAAQAQDYYYDGYGRYYDGYRGRHRYRPGDYYYGRGYRARRYYNRGYYNRGYYDRGYYRRGYRCGSGTTGAIIGGASGALIGREIDRSGRRYGRYGRYRGRDNGATGAIIGGVIGALVGREAARYC